MTLEELRKLRDTMDDAREAWLTMPDGSVAHQFYELATNVYEIASVEYVDSLLDAMPPEVK